MPQLLEVSDLTNSTGYINAACIGRAFKVDDRQVRAALQLPSRLEFIQQAEPAVKNFPQGDPLADLIMAEETMTDDDGNVVGVTTTYEPILAIELTHLQGAQMFIIGEIDDLSRALRRASVNPKQVIIPVLTFDDEGGDEKVEDATA